MAERPLTSDPGEKVMLDFVLELNQVPLNERRVVAHVPEGVVQLLKNALAVDSGLELANLFFADPLTAEDLTEMARERGAATSVYFKELNSQDGTQPTVLFTVAREQETSLVWVVMTDHQLHPTWKYEVLASQMPDGRMSINLSCTVGNELLDHETIF